MKHRRWTLAETVALARKFTDDASAVEFRAKYVERAGSQVDSLAEQRIDEFRLSFVDSPLRIVPVERIRSFILSHTKISEIDFCGVRSRYGVRSICGYVENHGSRASVIYDASQNLCWRRFTVTKELMHLLSETVMDDDDQDGIEYANSTIQNAVASRDVRFDSDDLGDEASAFFMAMEVLLPWRLRPQFIRLMDLGATDYQIAKVFMIPMNFVKLFKEGRESGMSLMQRSAQINLAIDAKKGS